MGIVGSVMGWEKNSYYEKLSSNNFRFGVRVLSPLKKSFQRLNFLSIKKTGDISKSIDSDFRGLGGRIQTPFEIISGLNLTKDEVVYQIFLQPVENNNPAFEEIKKQFLERNPVYNLSLGPANFQAYLKHVELIQGSNIEQKETDDFILIHSAIPVSHVEELAFEKKESYQYNFVEEDMMPGEFVGNYNREVKSMNRLLFSTTNHPLRIKLKAPYVQLKTKNESLNIQFMDK
jgi:CRISPR-associated protein Cas5h